MESETIPTRFANLQFGGAIGNRIKKVVSTTRKTISHYELEFHAENYQFDFSENRINALLHLLNKSIDERVMFYQEQINIAIINEHHHGIKIQERLFCLFEKVDTDNQEPPTGFVVPKRIVIFANCWITHFYIRVIFIKQFNKRHTLLLKPHLNQK